MSVNPERYFDSIATVANKASVDGPAFRLAGQPEKYCFNVSGLVHFHDMLFTFRIAYSCCQVLFVHTCSVVARKAVYFHIGHIGRGGTVHPI